MADKIKEKNCELCNEKATNICFDCFFYLCDSCFNFLHEKKANSGHKKENIDYSIPIDIKCQTHPKVPMNLFCAEEKGKIIIYYLLYIIIYSFFMSLLFGG